MMHGFGPESIGFKSGQMACIQLSHEILSTHTWPVLFISLHPMAWDDLDDVHGVGVRGLMGDYGGGHH